MSRAFTELQTELTRLLGAIQRNVDPDWQDIITRLFHDPSVEGSGVAALLTSPGSGAAQNPLAGLEDVCTSDPPSICDACREGPFAAQLGLFRDKIELQAKIGAVGGGYAYSRSGAELDDSASAGCRWCRLVRATLQTRYAKDGDDWRSRPSLDIRLGSHLNLGGTPEGVQDLGIFVDGEMHFWGYLYTKEDDPAAGHIVARSRVLDVGSPRALALAEECIVQCVQGHPRCAPARSRRPPLLPTRLIDCTDPENPRLVTTEGARGAYLALSYVWGEPQHHSTTTSNISAYASRIDPSLLPNTIRDAIQVTHALGFKYLWADTFCIVQDSDEDKRREIGRMRSIYRDAFLTIIASSARRVSEGFLQDRPAAPHTESGAFLRDITLPFVCSPPASDTAERSTEQLGEVYLSPRYMQGISGGRRKPWPSVQYDPAMEPVSSRGWCMQEHMMSPRSLLFASHTLQFRCHTTAKNIGGAYHDMAYETHLPGVLLLEDPPLVEPGSEVWKELHHVWQDVVSDYTGRSITVLSDKLVACAGIAEEFNRALRTEYLAGLWRDTLLTDLLWYKTHEAHLPRPTEYRAPSWSWAALDGPVLTAFQRCYLFSTESVPVAEIIHCEVSLVDDELPFGQVSAASLVLRTRLVPCTWDLWGGRRHHSSLYSRPFSVERQVDSGAPSTGEAWDESETGRTDGLGVVYLGVGHLDSQDDAHIEEVWASPIFTEEGDDAAGLILTPVEVDGEGEGEELRKRYRRIGFFNCDLPKEVEALPLMEIEII